MALTVRHALGGTRRHNAAHRLRQVIESLK
nr:MAG TPA: vacuolar protein sorting-associated protein [Caudoviricetes sp.]